MVETQLRLLEFWSPTNDRFRESSQEPVLRGNIHRETVESPHGGTPAGESHARPDGCGGHHLRFCENGFDR